MTSLFPGITMEKTKELITACGASYHEVDCGGNGWVRLFVIRPDGVTCGKIAFYRGECGGFKSYKRDYIRTVDATDRVFFRLSRAMCGKSLISDDDFDRLESDALEICRADLREKQAWRDKNPPKPGKTRKKITGRNPRIVLRSLINGM